VYFQETPCTNVTDKNNRLFLFLFSLFIYIMQLVYRKGNIMNDDDDDDDDNNYDNIHISNLLESRNYRDSRISLKW